jgi:hypothetical protein
LIVVRSKMLGNIGTVNAHFPQETRAWPT